MWLLRGPTTRDAELQRDDAEDTIDEDAIEDPAAEEDTDGDGSALRMGGGLHPFTTHQRLVANYLGRLYLLTGNRRLLYSTYTQITGCADNKELRWNAPR